MGFLKCKIGVENREKRIEKNSIVGLSLDLRYLVFLPFFFWFCLDTASMGQNAPFYLI
jgi:hypothetical protein